MSRTEANYTDRRAPLLLFDWQMPRLGKSPLTGSALDRGEHKMPNRCNRRGPSVCIEHHYAKLAPANSAAYQH